MDHRLIRLLPSSLYCRRLNLTGSDPDIRDSRALIPLETNVSSGTNRRLRNSLPADLSAEAVPDFNFQNGVGGSLFYSTGFVGEGGSPHPEDNAIIHISGRLSIHIYMCLRAGTRLQLIPGDALVLRLAGRA